MVCELVAEMVEGMGTRLVAPEWAEVQEARGKPALHGVPEEGVSCGEW